MAYCTVDDLQQAFGGSARLIAATDWDDDRIADVAVIDKALAGADAEINTYVDKQYRVPLFPVPDAIRDCAARIAKFRILNPRGMVDSFVADEHAADVLWLEGVRDGLNSLGIEPVPVASSMRIDAQSPRPGLKDVSRAKLRGFS